MRKLEMIRAAVAYIEEHLSEKLDLEQIAQALHYSKFHLHRSFTETVGLTIHDYVQRRQLTEAAKLLVFSEQPILEIALLAGYESQQAFSTVFKYMYKATPQQFRAREQFYPLQLRFTFDAASLPRPQAAPQLLSATAADIPDWLALVRLVVDGFPHLDETEYEATLRRYIAGERAFLLRAQGLAVGLLLLSYEAGSIDFLAVHPLYRKQGLTQQLLAQAAALLTAPQISLTTFRAGDKADTGQRRELLQLGFAEAELLTEFGYPTQRLVWSPPGAQEPADD